MSFIVLVGSSGRMSTVLQTCLQEQKKSFKLFSPKADPKLKIESFENSLGVIDFSTPEISEVVYRKALQAKVPYVCGTTGWADKQKILKDFTEAAKTIPIVLDSNFSLGIELLCDSAMRIAKVCDSGAAITDIHHIHKKDAPSGTALKIKDRILSAKSVPVTIESVRVGEVFGEHRVLYSFQDETIELVHKALNRRPFALGAIHALEWVQKKQPKLYSMKDVLE